MFSIRHSSDTGWIFPRKKKKTKQNNNTWPPTFTTALLRQFFFRGGFPKAARCQNHLKSHRRRGSECFFRETSHRPEQGWKCAQRFYRSCFFFCLCFSFSFSFFFTLLGPCFWQCKTSHQVSERMSSNTTVKESYWKAVFTAGPPDYEWMNK